MGVGDRGENYRLVQKSAEDSDDLWAMPLGSDFI